MGLYDKLESDMKSSLKNSEVVKLSVLRMLIAAIRQTQIDGNKKIIEDPDVLQILTRQVKQHKDSIVQFKNGNRQDLADKELAELKILESYLPEQISEEELTAIVAWAITESGATTKAEIGKVMKLIMSKTANGCCDGKQISQLVMRSLK